jgi:hypothetical protein
MRVAIQRTVPVADATQSPDDRPRIVSREPNLGLSLPAYPTVSASIEDTTRASWPGITAA